MNGTFSVITHPHENCIVVQKLTNPSQKYPVSRFCQKMTIPGASYTIMRQQFPLQLVTVHRVQRCTVQKAIVCLNANFFESGQAYVALSRIRKLEDLILWDFDPSAIYLAPFYKQLLEWCDYVDVIRPTKPEHVVDYPTRVIVDDEVDIVSVQSDSELSQTAPIPFSTTHDDNVHVDTQIPKCKRGRLRKEPDKSRQPTKKLKVSTEPKQRRGPPRTQAQTVPTEPKRKRRRPRKLVNVVG